MIAWINGMKVEGTPEELMKLGLFDKPTTPLFTLGKDTIPYHVKLYSEAGVSYRSKDDRTRVWI